MATNKLIVELKARAEKLGFVQFGVGSADAPQAWQQNLTNAINEQWHGDMEWMAETLDRRISLKRFGLKQNLQLC